MGWRILRVQLMLETGLPLSYFDELDITEIGDIVGYRSGTHKAQKRENKEREMGL